MNEIERIIALIKAGPVVRMLRDGGVTWEDIARKFQKRANPLKLSVRQLQRIYEGPDAKGFDSLKRVVRSMDARERAKRE